MENNEKPKFTVKEVTGVETKSTAQVEEELLKEHEEKFQAEESNSDVERVDASSESTPPAEEQKEVHQEEEASEASGTGLEDKDILEYIKNRYNKDIASVDDLFSTQKENEELPEDVQAFFKYKKETGRGMSDFLSLQKDYAELDDDKVLTDYYSHIEEGLDEIDVQDLIDDKFGYDADLDEEKIVKKKRLAKKRELSKARKFFEEQKEQYKLPLESRGDVSSNEQQEEYDRYKSYMEESETREEARKKRYEQGKSEAIDDVSKKSKNIDMVRKTPQTFSKNGLKIRAVGDTSSGRGLRIKSIKKS